MSEPVPVASQSARRDLTRGPVERHLVNLTVPMIWGIIAFMSVSLADAYFLGQLGTDELAAISFTFPVVFTLSTMAIGLGAGAGSVVSRAIGENDHRQVRRLATDSLILALLIVAVCCVLGWLTIDPLFRLLGAEGEIHDLVRRYMRIWYLGMPFLVVPLVANNLIRANGDARVPSLILIVSAAMNVGLAFWLIFGGLGVPPLGIEGAAWASLLARAAAFVLSLTIIITREKLIAFVRPPAEELLASWRRVLGVGIPAALGNMMNPIGVGLVTGMIATFGSENVAAFGAATRIEMFAAIPLLALSAAIGPIAGQNWGAGTRRRVDRALRLSFGFAVVWALAMSAAAFFGASTLARAFTTDPAVAAEIARYLHIVSTSLMGYGVIVVAAACCNAIGYPRSSLTIFLGRMAILYVPLSWIAARFFDVSAIYWAIWLANMLAGLLAGAIVLRIVNEARGKGGRTQDRASARIEPV
ncbi:MAG: MATE family efflux transporter [Hyphomicrobiaceae bacterium]